MNMGNKIIYLTLVIVILLILSLLPVISASEVDKISDVRRVASGTGKAISTVGKIGGVGRGIDKGANIVSGGMKYANPRDIRYTQGSISKTFRDNKPITETIEGLRSGTLSPNQIDPIRTITQNEKTYSLDNRRLFAFKQAGVKSISILPQDISNPNIIKELRNKFTTITDGTKIKFGGKYYDG